VCIFTQSTKPETIMSLKTTSLSLGATGMSVVGGTPVNLIVNNSSATVVNSQVDEGLSIAERTLVKFTAKAASLNVSSPGGFSQQRNKIGLVRPAIAGDGSATHNSTLFQINFDEATAELDVIALIMNTAELAVQAATRDFMLRGATE
jgi:hypothetical protein